MNVRRSWVVLAMIASASVVLFARAEVKVTPIVDLKGHVQVTFSSKDAWNLSTRDVLQKGLELKFEYEIDLRRPQPFWFFDSVLAHASVTSAAKFDTLTRRYRVNRMRTGSIFKSEFRDQEADVREWLTTFEQVELDPVTPLEPNGEYYVQVVLTIRPKRSVSLLSLLPFAREENAGRRYFTYIAR